MAILASSCSTIVGSHSNVRNCNVRFALGSSPLREDEQWCYYYCFYSVESTAHVRPPRAGGIACCRSTTKQKPVLVCEEPRAWVREKACSKIKLLLVVRVDATHHSTGPTCLPLNLAERPAVYNIFAATSNIYPPQIKIYIPVLTIWACKLQSPGWQVGLEDYFNFF